MKKPGKPSIGQLDAEVRHRTEIISDECLLDVVAALKERVEMLLARTGFASKGVFVMDGSRRSSHGNAYFTGVGRNKRIVFFDTLLERLGVAALVSAGRHRCRRGKQ